ncbi:MAG TPA: RNA polymerase subunit sigma-70 [Polyangiales bacterium]|nr:RNA polymerase subunit sigma-70 [Polyangiales bacterium]
MPPRDEATFLQSIEPLRAGIRLHCYRMLGSSHDGDDVLQETLLRAWRAKDSLADEALLKPWLYRIATNVCIDELKRRPPRLLAVDAYPPSEDARPPFPRIEEPVWLEPMPNSWLEGADQRDPQARYALKESVALAFVAALQCLSPMQRATLLLRDVVGLSADETANALDASVDAANSALFRARNAIDKKLGGSDPADIAAHAQVDARLLEQYVRAFEDADLDALVALFHDDMRTTMPPAPTWVLGRAANERFYRAMFGNLVPGQFRHLHIGANGQIALAFYRPAARGAPLTLSAIQLVVTRESKILAVDHFMLTEVFGLFEVPREWAAPVD